jgi:hypothetical protein
LALSALPIDASAFAAAIELEASQPIESLDFRTRLLIRDGVAALRSYWGSPKMDQWLSHLACQESLRTICDQDLGKPGFTKLVHRIMEATRRESVVQFLRDLGAHCPQPSRIEVGGAIAAILAGVLSRHTEDIDVVDEIPVILRSQHQMLDDLAKRYGLGLTHFQSHFLPTGWQTRLHHFDHFGNLEVLIVDPVDLFVGKLFSARIKDRDDLRAMARHLDRGQIEARFRDCAAALIAEPRLASFASQNWYIVYGDALPPHN